MSVHVSVVVCTELGRKLCFNDCMQPACHDMIFRSMIGAQESFISRFFTCINPNIQTIFFLTQLKFYTAFDFIINLII
jgi:hypothetical protein